MATKVTWLNPFDLLLRGFVKDVCTCLLPQRLLQLVTGDKTHAHCSRDMRCHESGDPFSRIQRNSANHKISPFLWNLCMKQPLTSPPPPEPNKSSSRPSTAFLYDFLPSMPRSFKLSFISDSPNEVSNEYLISLKCCIQSAHFNLYDLMGKGTKHEAPLCVVFFSHFTRSTG
jgi:hypothetical protein